MANSYGGQALIEGVMMRGKHTQAMCARLEDGRIVSEVEEFTLLSQRNKFFALPLVRGVCSMIDSLVSGMQAIVWSTNVSLAEDEEEEEGGKSKIKFAPLAVFCTFFVAELGDKTQLTAITFGANEGMGAAFIVWIGCSLGLFLADILGMLVGYLLKSKTPDGLLNTLAFVIFAIFGIYTAYQALNLISESVCPITVWPLLAAVTVAFVVICVWLYMKKKKGQDVSADKG